MYMTVLSINSENNEIDRFLNGAANYQIPSKLCQLFASILLFCDIQELNTFKLFHDHKNNLNEDFIYRQTN
uniref:Uncharacterized protein n=1 Tax=Rhizophagus irregularis (strain DAOM 181602 / DAOM 197198 / MUCL 43194) TaxID=747089 RepID=U9UAX9_RHIID